jgi:aryl-alcohol dehydrogenase-like predicted oxidoreductase
MKEPDHVAIGTWSGGRFMRFGEAIDEDRLVALLRPDDGIRTLLTADVYGEGEADRLLARALEGLDRDSFFVAGAVGHDFYEGERQGAKGFPRFTRTQRDHAGYLTMATERSLERCGLDRFDLLLLHNPDREGYTSETVWEGMRALRDGGLARAIGVAPGPANGFTLDLISCFERFGEAIDWAMIILNPLEPWPGEMCLPAALEADVRLITRVVDYGGLFHDDVLPGHQFPQHDHRGFRPAGWVEEGRAKLDRMRHVGAAHGLTPLQLACQWNLAHEPVECVVPTLIQEAGESAKAIEAKRAELAAVPRQIRLSPDEVATVATIGDNKGCMKLKGAVPDHDGPEQPDRWELTPELEAAAGRWGIEPYKDLIPTH